MLIDKSELFQRGYAWAKREITLGKMTVEQIEARICDRFDHNDFDEGAIAYVSERLKRGSVMLTFLVGQRVILKDRSIGVIENPPINSHICIPNWQTDWFYAYCPLLNCSDWYSPSDIKALPNGQL